MGEPISPTPPPALDLRPTPPRARLLSSRALAIGVTLVVAMAWVVLQAIAGSPARPKAPAPAPPPPSAAAALQAQIDSALSSAPPPRSWAGRGEDPAVDPWGGGGGLDPEGERVPMWAGDRAGPELPWGEGGREGGRPSPPAENPLKAALESPIQASGGARATAPRGAEPVPPDFGALLAALAPPLPGGSGEEARPEREAPRPVLPAPPSRLGVLDLAAGTVLPAVLSHRLQSDLPGVVTARVAADVRDTLTGSRVLVPAGTQLFGRTSATVRYGDRRLAVVWERLTFPDGRRLEIEEPSADAAGGAGLAGRTDNHFGRLFGGALLLSVLGAGTQLSQPDSYNGSASLPGLTPGQVGAASLGQRVSEVSTEVIRREMAVKPTIQIAAGTLFNVVLTRDLHFPAP